MECVWPGPFRYLAAECRCRVVPAGRGGGGGGGGGEFHRAVLAGLCHPAATVGASAHAPCLMLQLSGSSRATVPRKPENRRGSPCLVGPMLRLDVIVTAPTCISCGSGPVRRVRTSRPAPRGITWNADPEVVAFLSSFETASRVSNTYGRGHYPCGTGGMLLAMSIAFSDRTESQ